MKKRSIFTYLMLLLIVINLAMGYIGIINASSNDEYVEVIEALRVDSGHFNLERWTKRVYLYVLAVEYAIYFVIGYIAGWFSSIHDFSVKIARDLEPLLLMGRGTSVILKAITVWIIYKIGHRIHSAGAGFIAALFLSTTATVIRQAHYARTDTMLVFLMVCTIYFIVSIFQDETLEWKHYAFAGFLSGVAIQCKIQGVVLFAPALIVHFMKREKTVPIIRHFISMRVWIFLLFIVLGLISGNPAIVIAPVKFIVGIMKLGSVYSKAINYFVPENIGYIAYIPAFLKNMGNLLGITVTISLAWVMIKSKRNKVYLIVVSYIIVFYIILGGSRYNVIYEYMLPLYPFLYICLAIFLIDAVEWLVPNKSSRKYLIIILCLILLSYPVKRSTAYVIAASQKNTRVTAKEWIEKNIPFHSKIIMDSGRSINSFAPKIAEDRNSLNRTIFKTKENMSASVFKHGLITERSLVFYELLLETVPESSYDITSTGQGFFLESLDYYKNNGFEYAIISKEVSSRFLSKQGRNVRPQTTRFYEDVFRELCLIKTMSHESSFELYDTFYIYSFKKKC